MNSHALILLWQGESVPDYLVQKVAEILINNGICAPERLIAKYKDADGIANALLRDIAPTQFNTAKKENAELAEAVKQAVVYIGKRFEASLTGTNGPTGNIAMFAVELSNAVTTARRNISFVGVGTNNELLTAIEILSTTTAVIPPSLAKKYHFTQNVVDVIKKVYNSY